MAQSSRVHNRPESKDTHKESERGEADAHKEFDRGETEDVSGTTGSLRLLSLLWQARAKLALPEIELLATELESEIEASPEDDIDAIYGAIRSLLSQAPTKSSEAEYTRLVERLRTLQEAEAEQMQQYFDQHRALKDGSGFEALENAERLLSKSKGLGSNYGSVAAPHARPRRAARETSST